MPDSVFFPGGIQFAIKWSGNSTGTQELIKPNRFEITTCKSTSPSEPVETKTRRSDESTSAARQQKKCALAGIPLLWHRIYAEEGLCDGAEFLKRICTARGG